MATKKRPPKPFKSSLETIVYDDEILREVYANRDAYAAEHGNDLRRICEDLRKRGEERLREREKQNPKAR